MLRILYVEDNAANLSLLYRVAKMGGHEVINRSTGEKALADFDAIKPDLVLMDVQLEGVLTGLQVVERLRAQGHTLPIVAVTAYAMKGDREQALAAGCDDYLPKPLPIKRLVALLEHYQREIDTKKAKTAPPPAKAAPLPDLTAPDTATIVAPKVEDKDKTITTEAARQLDPHATTSVEAARDLDPNPTLTARATDANEVVEVENVKVDPAPNETASTPSENDVPNP